MQAQFEIQPEEKLHFLDEDPYGAFVGILWEVFPVSLMIYASKIGAILPFFSTVAQTLAVLDSPKVVTLMVS